MDAVEVRRKHWEDFEMTKEELNTFSECMKKEEFRKLLIEYAEEVNNPKNKKIYENEIAQLEKQRGVDVTFVNPEPGYVIKTSVNGDRKCFLNISKSEVVGKPISQPSYEQGNRGLQWSIPHTLSPPRDDLDKKYVRCTVFDIVFHPDTLYLASRNERFREIINNTAMDGIENNFKVKLDRKNIKFPKLSFKGISQSSVIRKTCAQPEQSTLDMEPEIYQKLISSYDESRARQLKRFEEKPRRPASTSKYLKPSEAKSKDAGEMLDYVIPKYVVKHQSDVELEDFRNDSDAKINAAIPKKLVVVIDLPLLKTATAATLDVQEKLLILKSEKPAKYYLELPLSFRVNADNGNAKFDIKYKKLTVTLPVIRSVVSSKDLHSKEDSGVDSDNGSPVHVMVNEKQFVDSNSNTYHESYTHSSDENNDVDASNVVVLSASHRDRKYQGEKRTDDNVEIEDALIKPNIKYALPAFFCNVFESILAITMNVKNVQSECIKYRVLDCNSGVHVVMKSLGAGFFPIYYSLCIKIRDDLIDPSSIVVEPWDNNVVLTITLKNTENLTQYAAGLNESLMEDKYFSCIDSVKKKLKDLTEAEKDTTKNVEVRKKDDSMIININSHNTDSEDDKSRSDIEASSRYQERKRVLTKSRSISESSGDELQGNPERYKGILKSRRDFSRSVSESSIDDGMVHASSIHCNYDSAQEINSESECGNLKKTVRFNEVVSKQLYRSNSSILGQRKKNQRKLRNKKRAYERRMSESENSEAEEREKYKSESKITGV